MTKHSYIFISLFIAIMLLALMLGCSFLINANEKANAEYIDVLNDSSSIVNFNQLFDSTTVRSSYSGITYTVNNGLISMVGTNNNTYNNFTLPLSDNAINLYNNHKYYIRFVISGINLPYEWGLVDSINNTIYKRFNSSSVSNSDIVTISSNTTAKIFAGVSRQSYYNCEFYVTLIDLTQCFGSGNEPNLSQCEQLFVADYYPYNSGSPVSLSGLNSYAQGYANALNSNEYVFNEDILRSMIFLNVGNRIWGASSDDDIGVEPNSSNQASLGINLPSTLYTGDTLTITALRLSVFTSSAVGSSSWRPDLYVGYYSNGAFVSLGQFEMSYFNNPDMYYDGSYEQFYKDVTFTVNLPTNVDTIYINCNLPFSFMNPQIKAITNNLVYAIDNSYKDGYANAQQSYEQLLATYYGSNGTGGSNYEAIWNEAYNVGLNANISNARKKTYTFTAFLGALFDVPVSTIKSLLDFNFLGFNLKNFVFSLLTLSIVFAIIKLILVKTGDDK